MLATDGNKIFHWWIWTFLSDATKKLGPLTKTNCIISIFQIGIFAELLTNLKIKHIFSVEYFETHHFELIINRE